MPMCHWCTSCGGMVSGVVVIPTEKTYGDSLVLVCNQCDNLLSADDAAVDRHVESGGAIQHG